MKVPILVVLVASLGVVFPRPAPASDKAPGLRSQTLSMYGDTLWEGCSYNGIELHGNVQTVDAFPDIKVQLVDAFPDIRVKWVTVFPDDCGEWQEVDAFPDFKIQMVDAFPDIKIQVVESFPGIG